MIIIDDEEVKEHLRGILKTEEEKDPLLQIKTKPPSLIERFVIWFRYTFWITLFLIRKLFIKRKQHIKHSPLGFVSEFPIKPGQTIRVVTRPYVVFNGNRLIIPSAIASNFEIQDLKIGNRSQFPCAVSIPGEAFQENVESCDLNCDIAYPAIDICIDVKNISDVPVLFRAVLIGTVVKDQYPRLMSDFFNW